MKTFCYRLLLSAVLLATAAAPLRGQLLIDYCGDYIADKGQGAGSASSTVHAAMRLTSQQLAPSYQLAALYVGLSLTEGITSLRAWVTTGLGEGDTLACVEADVASLRRGWNVLTLPEGVTLGDREALYFGYSYTQTERIYPISYGGTRGQEGSFWMGVDSRWSDYHTRYAPVSIRVAVRSPHSRDVRVLGAALDRRTPLPADTLRLHAELQNLGADTLRTFVVGWQAGAASGSTEWTCLVPFGQRTEVDAEVPLPADARGAGRQVRLEVSLPNGEADEVPADNVWTLWYDVLEAVDADLCGLLVEEFTSLDNGYAPLGHARLAEALALAGADGGGAAGPQVVCLSRHEGYGPDDGLRVSAPADYAPTLFGTQRLAFAPAFALDRTRSALYDTLMHADGAAASTLLPPARQADLIAEALARPRYCYLHADAAPQPLDDGRWRVEVTVYSPCPALLANARFEAVVVQDRLTAGHAANYFADLADGLELDATVLAYAAPDEAPDLADGLPLADILTGNAPFGTDGTDAADGTALPVARFTLRVARPATLPDGEAWRLVAYVHSRDDARTVLGVTQVVMP